MSLPRPPVKTPLGLDEWRTRAHGLNQRHRTMLFLVDGRRLLSEVLALGVQAGARTTHLEDLVRLGMVEVAIDAEPAAATAPRPPPVHDRADRVDTAAVSGARSVDLPAPVQAPLPTLTEPVAAAVAEVAPASAFEQRRALADVSTEELHQQVRTLLMDTLRIDAPLFAAVTLVRVRRAQTTKDLINLVWEIERHLVASRKSKHEMQSVCRARDLLGMGNTQVSTDTPPGFADTQ